MSDDLIVLVPGTDGDPETGDGWMRQVALEHVDPNGVGVIVGETAEGYAEGVDARTFEAIRQYVDRDAIAKQVGDYLWRTLEIERAHDHVRFALGLPQEEER